ncbi:MAG: diguanylate cyclase [Dehalococcoidia bacterium]
MSVAQFPTYLRIIGAGAAFEREHREPTPIRNFDLDPATGVATRQALLNRTETMGELAPTAPLSFLVVKVAGAKGIDSEDQLRLIASRINELTRGVDIVGRLTGTSFGIALQGAGYTAAGAVAARLTHHLNRMAELSPSICITVSAATGTGVNAETLPLAAMDTCEPCCG